MIVKQNKKNLKINKTVNHGLFQESKNMIVKFEKEIVEYFVVHHSQRHPIVKHYHKSRLFLKWAIKLLVPDFLVGHPNLWDNLRALRKHHFFKPLRVAIVAWLIFSLAIGSAGIYALIESPITRASSEFSIKTGYYMGNGTALSITGLNWKPDLLLIKSDTAAGQIIWKSSAMPDPVVSYLGVATADNTDSEVIFNTDGFSVSGALEVNTKNVRYTYVAFSGADCTAESGLCVGKYTGAYTATVPNKSITGIGFQPKMVWIKRTSAVVGNFTTATLAAMSPLYATYFSAVANDVAGTGTLFRSLDADGFSVGSNNNTLGAVFYYVAFNQTVNKFIEGGFTGTGVDNKNITGTGLDGTSGTAIGFEPDFVFVKQNSAIGPVFNTTECWGDNSMSFLAAAAAVNNIQELRSDGFQVGNSTAVNTSPNLNLWFAFGGAPDPAPSETFSMQKGTYLGDSTSAHFIATSFYPELVFIKANDSAQYGVYSTFMEADQTHYVAYASGAFATGIISMGPTGFILGTNATVNSIGVNYDWVAFGNSTNPEAGSHANDFFIGYYGGNGLNPRIIDHLGITPDMLVVEPQVVSSSSNITYWKSSSMVGTNETAYFNATANDTGGTLIRSLDSSSGGGFTLGSSANLSTSAVNHIFFGFKEGAGIFDVGTYTGNNVNDTQITAPGFQPDYVWTKRNAATGASHRPNSWGVIGAFSQYFSATVNAINMITGFVANGFKLGTASEANTSTANNTYHYAAWRSTYSLNLPNTPTNVSPSAGATEVNLDATLTASNYIDLDSNAHTITQWQIDNNSDFATPVWTRTSGSAETNTSITPGKGTFANELVGKTELNHNSIYYWRVAYSDGTWSSWSTGTAFTTNIFTTVANQLPADGDTATTLTPTLIATSFDDSQESHSAVSAQWQINTNSNFASPMHDSGAVAYENSFVVPNAILADRGTYYWRVRYLDSGGQWSAYSTQTKFLVSESVVSVTTLFGNLSVNQGYAIKIDAKVQLTNGAVINDATVRISIYNPNGGMIIDRQVMPYLSGSNGVYRYNYTIPVTNGSYLYEVTATSGGVNGYNASTFEVGTVASNVENIQTKLAEHEVADAIERVAQSAFREDTTSRLTSIESKVNVISSTLDTVDTNLSSTSSLIESIRATQLDDSSHEGTSSVDRTDEVLAQLAAQSEKLNEALKSLDVISPDVLNLLDTGKVNTKKIIDVQNKLADLRAISATTRRIIDQKTVEPIVETYMKFNSVEIHFLITNPDSSQQVVKFKAFLPEEAKSEHIIDLSGLSLDYDANAKAYYVSGSITLGPKESITKKVEMKDIWMFSDEEIKSIKDQSDGLLPTLDKTQYEAQGTVLKNDINSNLNIISLRQKESYSSPQEHIIVYRENNEKMTQVKNNLEKLKDLVVQAGASRGMVGQVGGIQTFATWGIILAIVFGFSLLAAIIFAMWRHQTILATTAMGLPQGRLITQYAGNYGVANNVNLKHIKKLKIIPIKSSSINTTTNISSWLIVFCLTMAVAFLAVKFSPILLSKKKIKIEGNKISSIVIAKPKEEPVESNREVVISEKEQAVMEVKKDEKSVKEIEYKLKILETPTGWLNVRDTSSLDGKSVAKVNPGENYVYTDKQNDWYKITLNDGTFGWVNEKYVQTIGN